MTGEVFYWLFNMSITAALTGAVVLLLRLIKKIPRRVCAFLWLIPFIRMWIPLGIGGRFGLMSLLSRISTKTVTVLSVGETVDFTTTNLVMAANSYYPITYKVSLLDTVFDVCGAVWLTVASALALTFAIIYCISIRELRTALPLRDDIYVSDKIQSPAVYGIFRPRIILPESYRERDLTYILTHERAHIARGDNLWRLLAFMTDALHWFNPFAWLFLRCFLSDLELACDERVLARCDGDARREYASALLECSVSRGGNAFVSSFGGAGIRVRIENILSYRKMSAFAAVCFSALIAVIAYILLTNAS